MTRQGHYGPGWEKHGMWYGRWRQRRRERGATLAETAIVAPVILFIVFGIIQISFVFRSASITTTASRAGARVGASAYGDAGTNAERLTVRQTMIDAVEAALADLRDEATPTRVLIYEAPANGDPPASCTVSCVEYQWNSTTDQFDEVGGSWNDPDNCGVVLDFLGVHVEVDHQASTPIYQSTFGVSERTVMRLEPGQFTLCTSE